MIKTTIDMDEDMIKRARSIFSGKTKKEIISIALSELVERYEQKDLYDLFDGDEQFISDDYDYKAMRGGVPNDFS